MEKDDYRDQQPAPTGGMTGEDSGLQANNLSPRGQGQPKKKKKKPVDARVVMQPYQEEQVDSRYNRFNQPGQQQGTAGVPDYYKQAYGSAGPALNPQVEKMRHMLSDPGGRQYNQVQGPNGESPNQQGGSMVAQWMKRNGGINPIPGGVIHPIPEQQGGLHDAFKQSVANNYTDIQDTNPWQTGQYMGQLQGFNTQGWGSGERGSGTLKNRFGQIASRYDVTQPGALQQLMQDPQFQEMTGGMATIVEHPNQDLIDFDGPGPMAPVDVIGNATAGGAGQNWWWGPTDEQGSGPQAPANQIYNQALQMPPGGMPQGGLEGFDPQQQQGQAMQFLQWLMQQQQQGNMTNGGLGDAPMF